MKNDLALCPSSGDDNITGFSRAKCDANAMTDCTSDERDSLTGVSLCSMQVSACESPADLSNVHAQVNECASGIQGVSSSCLTNAIEP